MPDTVILVRKAAWRRPKSTVITGIVRAPSYIRQGYAVDWDATEQANNAEVARLRADAVTNEAASAAHAPQVEGEGSRDENQPFVSHNGDIIEQGVK